MMPPAAMLVAVLLAALGDTAAIVCPTSTAAERQCGGARRASIGDCLVCVASLGRKCKPGTIRADGDAFCRGEPHMCLAVISFHDSLIVWHGN
jgi:hypothetical protein